MKESKMVKMALKMQEVIDKHFPEKSNDPEFKTNVILMFMDLTESMKNEM